MSILERPAGLTADTRVTEHGHTGHQQAEHSHADLGTLRWLLDIALQPLDRFDGFNRIDQVGPAALRYQLNYLQYALAMSQYTRTPAFTGYLAEAQRNLIEKMCDRRVWSYWFWQNLIGNWRWDADPIAYHNVMYTGFYGAMLGLYETLNDDARYSQPGALKLPRGGDRHFAYDYPQIAAAIRHNMEISRYTQYPCEPHLVYPMCNTFALNAVRMHDRLHGTDVAVDLVERVRESFTRDRFLRSDGRFLTGRGPLGLRFGVVVGNDMVVANWLHALMPDLARGAWDRVRSTKLELQDGTLVLDQRGGDRFDVGNYTRSPVMARALVMGCAREMGDEEVAQALQRELEAHDSMAWREPAHANGQRGARQFIATSTWGNAAYALALFSRCNGLRDLLNGVGTEGSRRGPLLTGAAYPEVLVARAVNDGETLQLVLQPGNGACTTTLAFGRLQPRMHYLVDTAGASICAPRLVAAADGSALLEIRLAQRTAISLRPADAGKD